MSWFKNKDAARQLPIINSLIRTEKCSMFGNCRTMFLTCQRIHVRQLPKFAAYGLKNSCLAIAELSCLRVKEFMFGNCRSMMLLDNCRSSILKYAWQNFGCSTIAELCCLQVEEFIFGNCRTMLIACWCQSSILFFIFMWLYLLRLRQWISRQRFNYNAVKQCWKMYSFHIHWDNINSDNSHTYVLHDDKRRYIII